MFVHTYMACKREYPPPSPLGGKNTGDFLEKSRFRPIRIQIALTSLLTLALSPKTKIKILICCKLGKFILCDQVFDSHYKEIRISGIEEIFA